MLNHIVLFRLRPEVTEEGLEEMMRQTRISLLKIPEILSVKCGKNIEPGNPWSFFTAIEVESSEKLALCYDDAIFIKYTEEIIKPNTQEQAVFNFEMDPGKDIRFS